MLSYNRNEPLIFNHIPKKAGTSVLEIFKAWFGSNCLLHYRHVDGPLPLKSEQTKAPIADQPVVIYGHFNRDRNRGIDQRYPEITQFVTILRDPWDRAISGYFYKKKYAGDVPDPGSVAAMEIDEFLPKWPLQNPDFGSPLASFMPRNCGLHDYKDMMDRYFVEIGIMEDLKLSLQRIAEKLGMEFNEANIPHLNTSDYLHRIPVELKEDFVRRNPIDYAIYNYARDGLL